MFERAAHYWSTLTTAEKVTLACTVALLSPLIAACAVVWGIACLVVKPLMLLADLISAIENDRDYYR